MTDICIDLSSNNGPAKLADLLHSYPDVKMFAVKATEGTGYTNPYHDAQKAQAKALGVPFLSYHFARPDANKGLAGGVAEADYFLSVAGPLEYEPVLDWEKVQDNEFAQAFVKRVYQKAGVWPIIYCSGSWVSSLQPNPYLAPRKLWVAAYGSNYRQYLPAGKSACMWQYTDAYGAGHNMDASYIFAPLESFKIDTAPKVVVEQVVAGGKVRDQVKVGSGRVPKLLKSKLFSRIVRKWKNVSLRRRGV